MKTNVQPVLLLTSLMLSYLFELVSDGRQHFSRIFLIIAARADVATDDVAGRALSSLLLGCPSFVRLQNVL